MKTVVVYAMGSRSGVSILSNLLPNDFAIQALIFALCIAICRITKEIRAFFSRCSKTKTESRSELECKSFVWKCPILPYFVDSSKCLARAVVNKYLSLLGDK